MFYLLCRQDYKKNFDVILSKQDRLWISPGRVPKLTQFMHFTIYTSTFESHESCEMAMFGAVSAGDRPSTSYIKTSWSDTVTDKLVLVPPNAFNKASQKQIDYRMKISTTYAIWSISWSSKRVQYLRDTHRQTQVQCCTCSGIKASQDGLWFEQGHAPRGVRRLDKFASNVTTLKVGGVGGLRALGAAGERFLIWRFFSGSSQARQEHGDPVDIYKTGYSRRVFWYPDLEPGLKYVEIVELEDVLEDVLSVF